MENIYLEWGKERIQATLAQNGVRVKVSQAKEVLNSILNIAIAKFKKELKEKYLIEDIFDRKKELELREISLKYVFFTPGYNFLFAYPGGITKEFFQNNVEMLRNEFANFIVEDTIKPQEKRSLNTAYSLKILSFIFDKGIQEKKNTYQSLNCFFSVAQRACFINSTTVHRGGYLKTSNVTTKKRLDLFKRGYSQGVFDIEFRSNFYELLLSKIDEGAKLYYQEYSRTYLFKETNSEEFEKIIKNVLNLFETKYFSEDPCFIQ